MLIYVSSLQNVAMESLWAKQPVVITFLRRFGWPFCRLGARQLSALKPRLDASNVRLVGVGLEELGVEEFVKGEFFKGGKMFFAYMNYKKYQRFIKTVYPYIYTAFSVQGLLKLLTHVYIHVQFKKRKKRSILKCIILSEHISACIFELPRDKTNKVSMRPAKDQSGHSPSLIRVFAVH